MSWVRRGRFAKFVSSLRFDQLLEFDEGDVGLGGGIQVKEPGNQNPTSDDIIQRFGGTSSPEMQWPEEEFLGWRCRHFDVLATRSLLDIVILKKFHDKFLKNAIVHSSIFP